jgi:hypothetical protein
MERVVREDFILVTRNARDFRGAGSGNPGGLHAAAELHAGLICIDAVIDLDFDLQHELFQIALGELTQLDDLTNQALEIVLGESGDVTVEVYDISSKAPE